MTTTVVTTQELIERTIQTFSDYDNDDKNIYILDFMMLLIETTKHLDSQDKEILDLRNEVQDLNQQLKGN